MRRLAKGEDVTKCSRVFASGLPRSQTVSVCRVKWRDNYINHYF